MTCRKRLCWRGRPTRGARIAKVKHHLLEMTRLPDMTEQKDME
jgi:hypothetical protein